jgi:hypothetical protein
MDQLRGEPGEAAYVEVAGFGVLPDHMNEAFETDPQTTHNDLGGLPYCGPPAFGEFPETEQVQQNARQLLHQVGVVSVPVADPQNRIAPHWIQIAQDF